MTGIKPGGPISATARLLGLSQTFPDRCASCIRRRHDLAVGCRSGFEATDFLPLVAFIQVWQSAISLQNMRGKTLRQAPPNMDDAVAEIDLRPGQKDDLGDAQAVTEGQENRRGIALAPAAALFGGGDQPLDLIRGQELAPPAIGVPAARRWPFRRRGLGLRLLRRREYCSILVVRHVFRTPGFARRS